MTVTDKAFGELVMNLQEFRALPECLTLREMQYRVVVKPSQASLGKREEAPTKNPKESLSNVGKVSRIEPMFQYLSPR